MTGAKRDRDQGTPNCAFHRDGTATLISLLWTPFEKLTESSGCPDGNCTEHHGRGNDLAGCRVAHEQHRMRGSIPLEPYVAGSGRRTARGATRLRPAGDRRGAGR